MGAVLFLIQSGLYTFVYNIIYSLSCQLAIYALQLAIYIHI